MKKEIEDIIGLDTTGCPLISAKEGIGIDEVLRQIVEKLPPPKGDPEAPLKALIFDSYYDNYRGAISMVRIVDGTVKAGDRIRMWSKSGFMHPECAPQPRFLRARWVISPRA